MAILDTEKIDFLWKRVIYGVSKTAGSLVKFGSNETIPSPLPVLPSSVWQDGDSIPATTPLTTTSLVQVYAGSSRIRMTSDPTSPANVAWLAASTFGDVGSRLTNFIPPTFGSGYAARVFIGDPNVGPAARIFPDTTDEEWVFDYAAGAVVFTGTIPTNKPATIGSGNVSVSTSGLYVELYRYIGAIGLGGGSGGAQALGDLTDVEMGTALQAGDVLTYKDNIWQAERPPGGSGGPLGTIASQDADNVAITGGVISNVTFLNVTVDGGEF